MNDKIDNKKLRENLGHFATGIVIACARRRNFFAQKFFNENFSTDIFVKKFEDFWQNFFQENHIGKKISKRFSLKNFSFPSINNLPQDGSFQQFLNEKILLKIKKIFAEEFFGMTINSFNSVSLDPPIISFCVDNKSANLKFFKKNRYFILNVLSLEQKDLSSAFATPKNSQKWSVEPYFFSKFGNPIFYNSVSYIECKKHKFIKIGDHHMIFGEVLNFGALRADSKPLIYFRGKYNELSK